VASGPRADDGPMDQSENTRRMLTALCAIATVSGTLLWGSGILLLGLAATAGARPLALALRRRSELRLADRSGVQPAPARLRPSGS
jgi:hypothetical protein